MEIKEITLKNFRSYENCFLKFDKGLNIISGKNASGKTNILEAVFMCAIGKSVRAVRDKELIKWGKEGFSVKLIASKRNIEHTVEIKYSQEGKKISVDGIPLLRTGELIGFFNAVYFSPDEIAVIKRSPQERRRFMDICLCQQNKNYFYSLTKYNKILAQRNKQLKEGCSGESLYIWDVQLAKEGSFIVKERKNFIDAVKIFAKEKHSALSADTENLEIELDSPYCCDKPEEEILKRLNESIQKDLIFKYTTEGIQKDDISIKINGIDLRKYGSQGQQRGATLSLKLAEIEYLKSQTGESPVVLLDDVLSELDDERKRALLNETSKIQCIISCTEFEEFKDIPHKLFLAEKTENSSNIKPV